MTPEHEARIKAESPTPGDVYQHFKGGIYIWVGTAISSDNHELLALYRGAAGSVWARSYVEFFDNIERDTYKGPRFTRLIEASKARASLTTPRKS